MDITTWNKKQLQDYLRKMKLPVSGNKQELINRINIPKSEYSNMKIPQLRNLLRSRKLHISGNKPKLIQRLEDHDTKIKISSSGIVKSPSPKKSKSPSPKKSKSPSPKKSKSPKVTSTHSPVKRITPKYDNKYRNLLAEELEDGGFELVDKALQAIPINYILQSRSKIWNVEYEEYEEYFREYQLLQRDNNDIKMFEEMQNLSVFRLGSTRHFSSPYVNIKIKQFIPFSIKYPVITWTTAYIMVITKSLEDFSILLVGYIANSIEYISPMLPIFIGDLVRYLTHNKNEKVIRLAYQRFVESYNNKEIDKFRYKIIRDSIYQTALRNNANTMLDVLDEYMIINEYSSELSILCRYDTIDNIKIYLSKIIGKKEKYDYIDHDDITVFDDILRGALDAAANRGDIEIFKLLLESGVKYTHDSLPGSIEMFKYLQTLGYKIKWQDLNMSGFSKGIDIFIPLDMIEYLYNHLLKYSPHNIILSFHYAMESSINSQELGYAEWLLSKGFNINNRIFIEAFKLAVSRTDDRFINLFISYGAKPSDLVGINISSGVRSYMEKNIPEFYTEYINIKQPK